MKKILLVSLLVFSFSGAKSQCSSIYGLVGNSGVDWSLVSVDRYTGTYTVKDTIFGMGTLIAETSTIEPDSNRYVTLGLS